MTKPSPEQLRKSMFLYAVTSPNWLETSSLTECVEQAILGGATFIQLRDHNASPEELKKQAISLRKLCKTYHVPFVIDDNVELAKELDLDGVHIGQADMPCSEARKLLGPDKIIGVSAQTVEHALKAQEDGADYLGVGPVFPTNTKPGAATVPFETVQAISHAVNLPFVIIGGLNESSISRMKHCGANGVAVVSAIFAAKDIQLASKALCEEIKKTLM